MEIKQRFVLGTPAPLATTGVDIAADNISATNVTTTNLAATNLSVGSTVVAGGIVDVKTLGAKGDGVTDDTAAIQNAISSVAGGGTVWFSPGTYKTSTELHVTGQNITLEGAGATILFNPVAPIVSGTNAFGITIASSISNPMNLLAGTAGAIALGAQSFVAANAADAATLQPNDWIILWEKDVPRQSTPYFTDQYQVASVSGTTVNLYQKVRTAFPGTHSTIQFSRVISLTRSITVRNLTILSNYTGGGISGLYVAYGARTVLIDDVTVLMTTGGAIATYLAADLKVVNCTFRSGSTANSPEFASSVDMIVENNLFGFYNCLPATLAVTVDFGTAFSSFSHNTITMGANFGVGVWFGVHNCAIIGNMIGWIRALGTGGTGIGISGIGSYSNTVIGNTLIGGDSTVANSGISFGDDTTASPNVKTQQNIISSNNISVTGFTYPTGPDSGKSTSDIYLDTTDNSTLLNTPGVKMGRFLQLLDLITNNPFLNFVQTGLTWSLGGAALGGGVNIFQINDQAGNVGLRLYQSVAGRMLIGAELDISDPTTANSPFIRMLGGSQEWDIASAPSLWQVQDVTGGAIPFRILKTPSQQIQFWGWASILNIASGFANAVAISPIAAQSAGTFTVPCSGSQVNDIVSVSPQLNPGPLTWSGFVSVNGTVTVQLANPTTAAVTPATTRWQVFAIRMF